MHRASSTAWLCWGFVAFLLSVCSEIRALSPPTTIPLSRATITTATCLASSEANPTEDMVTDGNGGLLVVLGLNGALQKRFVIRDHGNLVPGAVHRASVVQTGVGGKGQDAAIALHCLGVAPRALRLVQFLGSGPEGDTVSGLLRDRLGEEAVRETTLRVAGSLRTCTSIVGSKDTTELVEPSARIDGSEWKDLLDACGTAGLPGSTAGLCIMGSMPPGCPPDAYAEIYKKVAGSSTLCVMDSVAGLEAFLGCLVGPSLLKINIHELRALVGLPDGTSVAAAVEAFLEQHPAAAGGEGSFLRALAVTDGKHPAHLCCWPADRGDAAAIYQLGIPDLAAERTTLYPIGAGDAVAAGTLAAWNALRASGDTAPLPDTCRKALETRVQSLPDSIPEPAKFLVMAFSFGLACGSASCLQEENSVLEVSDVVNLFENSSHPTKL